VCHLPFHGNRKENAYGTPKWCILVSPCMYIPALDHHHNVWLLACAVFYIGLK
jgi:hypothetical protein